MKKKLKPPRDDAAAALADPLFRQRVVKSKKAYSRKRRAVLTIHA